jgi:hypothetical protein
VDVAVIVNLQARRGSRRVTEFVQRALPMARVLASTSLDEIDEIVGALARQPPELLIAGGGDGTAMRLLNALREHGRPQTFWDAGRLRPSLAMLPLGTGNGWANTTGAPRWRAALRRLHALSQSHEDRRGEDRRALPVRSFGLIEVDGRISHFAGSGFDAEVLHDFVAQKQRPGLLPRRARQGVAGYLRGAFAGALPRLLTDELPELELINTGDEALLVDPHGRAVPVVGGERGAVLYRGPVGVFGCGTTPEWGFRFRTFPFAGLVGGRFATVVFAGRPVDAALRAGALWRGKHPLAKTHRWQLNGCKVRFSRPVAFQVGGDSFGRRTEVDYRLAHEHVDLLDWSALQG